MRFSNGDQLFSLNKSSNDCIYPIMAQPAKDCLDSSEFLKCSSLTFFFLGPPPAIL